jgi:hypothetical protein
VGEFRDCQCRGLLYYDASWRLLEEHITTSYLDPDDPMGLNHIDKTMKTQHVWGSRHIDDAVMMRTDTNDDGTWDHEFYYAAVAQFSTLALNTLR